MEQKATWERGPLHVAAANARPLVVKFLVDRRVKILQPDAQASYPPHLCAGGLGRERQRIRCLEAMFDGGAKIQARDGNKQTSLFAAAR